MSLESMKQRLTFHGGAAQQDRMIKDKLRSMLSATKYSQLSVSESGYSLSNFEPSADASAARGMPMWAAP